MRISLWKISLKKPKPNKSKPNKSKPNKSKPNPSGAAKKTTFTYSKVPPAGKFWTVENRTIENVDQGLCILSLVKHIMSYFGYLKIKR